MKGFVKACLIAVLVFVVAGIVLLVVAAAGGVTRASLRLFSEQGRLGYGSMNIRLFDGFGITFGQDEPEIIIIDDSEEGKVTVSKGTYAIASTDVKRLQINVNAGDCCIEESKDGSFYVQGDQHTVEVDLDGDCLYVDWEVEQKIGIDFTKSDSITVFIPAGYQFDEVTADVGAGYLDIDTSIYSKDCRFVVGAGSMSVDADVAADYVQMDVGAGEIDASGCITAADRMELTVDMGEISLDQIDCQGMLKADCSIGNLEADGWIAGNVNASVDVGDMDLKLRSDEQNYTYTLEVGVGEIEVNDYSYSGIDRKITIEGDAGAPRAELSCGVGSLEISIR